MLGLNAIRLRKQLSVGVQTKKEPTYTYFRGDRVIFEYRGIQFTGVVNVVDTEQRHVCVMVFKPKWSYQEDIAHLDVWLPFEMVQLEGYGKN
jgi:uncharacterized protein YhbP (UPF0306 family)